MTQRSASRSECSFDFRILALLVSASCALFPHSAQADAYDDFHAFAQTAYGAERDSLVYDWFGQELTQPQDWWEYISESSAAIGFTTNLPARTHIEYGASVSYGSTTSVTDRHYAVHLHHLAGLQPGLTYHYRAVMEDERGQILLGPDRTISPASLSAAIRIPADVSGPPYVLDTPGAYYLVTLDLNLPRGAFELAASGITLDLGGHSVSYNNEIQAVSGSWLDYRDQAAFGLRSIGPDNFHVYNGRIEQGAAQNGAHPDVSIGFNPLFIEGGADFEVAGLAIEYGGSQMVGLYAHTPGGSNELHHNIFLDRGWEITNRHGTGSKSLAINGNINSFQTHHNLVKRTRQSALNGDLIHDNEIYIDSFATNSFGITSLNDDREAYGNRIFGTGYHVVAIGWGSNNWWHDNFIQLVGQGPDFRYAEYGNQESLNGFRLTQYGGATVNYANSVVERNLVLVSGGACSDDGECTQTRGLQYFSDPYVVNNVIRDNTIKVVMNDVVSQAAAIVTQGLFNRCGTEQPLYYTGNKLISNIANVRMGDYYGVGCNHQFLDNEMIRVAARADYKTFKFDEPLAAVDQHFYDTLFSGGADLALVEFTDPGQELTVGWTLTVSVRDDFGSVPGAAVTLRNLQDVEVAAGLTDTTGRFSQRLRAYTQTMVATIYETPTTVHVAHAGREQTHVVTMDGTKLLDVEFLDPTGIPERRSEESLTVSANPSVVRSETQLRWTGSAGGLGTLRIYDLKGRLVRAFTVPLEAGQVEWDGRDDRGARASSGSYLVRLVASGESAVCQVVLIR